MLLGAGQNRPSPIGEIDKSPTGVGFQFLELSTNPLIDPLVSCLCFLIGILYSGRCSSNKYVQLSVDVRNGLVDTGMLGGSPPAKPLGSLIELIYELLEVCLKFSTQTTRSDSPIGDVSLPWSRRTFP